MPKELTRKQPSSSLANVLAERSVGSATAIPGVHAPEPGEDKIAGVIRPAPRPEPTGEPTGEPANIPRQVMLTETCDQMLKRLVRIYSNAVGFDLSNAEMIRSILRAAQHAASMLEREATQVEPMKRPKNVRGNEAVRDQIEQNIARAFIAGMRAAPEME